MSYRELAVFVQHLPQDSWTQTILRDRRITELVHPETEQEPEEPKFGPWALINYQIASLTDAINALRYVTAVAGRLEGADPPKPVPRPGLTEPKKRMPRAAVLYIDQFRAKG